LVDRRIEALREAQSETNASVKDLVGAIRDLIDRIRPEICTDRGLIEANPDAALLLRWPTFPRSKDRGLELGHLRMK